MKTVDKSIKNRVLTADDRPAGGFTLIEIIAVVVILAIAALIAIPAFSGASEMQLKAAADKLAADIEYAKSMAVTTQKAHKVVFDTNAEAYDIWALESSTWTRIKDPVKKSDFRVAYPQDSRLSSVKVQAATFGGGSSVQFNATGTPQDDAGTALGARGEVELEAKGQKLKVIVEAVTGYVSIQ